MKTIFSLVAALLLTAGVSASDWKSKGEMTVESRLFQDDHLSQTEDSALGLFARLETDYKQAGWSVRVRGFGRVDRKDDNRDLTALEEAWLGYKSGDWELRLGYQMLNWTATEAFHPADFINSRNLDSNIENPEKLGELMVSLRRRLGDGGLTLFYLPKAEAPRLPGETSRLSFLPPGFSYGTTRWLSDSTTLGSAEQLQWGLRFNQTVGDSDFSIHHVDHLDRQQPLTQLHFTPTGIVVDPIYFRVRNSGFTYLHILGGLILKVEAAHKNFITNAREDLALPNGQTLQQVDHSQFAFGLEYGLSHESGSETTLLFEGQSILGTNEAERADLSLFQRDILLGVRHAFNDTMSRELLVTAIYDLERNHELLINTSYKQRLTDTWSLQGGLRYSDAPQKAAFPVGLEYLDDSHHLFLNVSRYF